MIVYEAPHASHICDPYGDHPLRIDRPTMHGDIALCEDCGRYLRFDSADPWCAGWKRLGRLSVWWARQRGHIPTPPGPAVALFTHFAAHREKPIAKVLADPAREENE